jgi:hypothetical protein
LKNEATNTARSGRLHWRGSRRNPRWLPPVSPGPAGAQHRRAAAEEVDKLLAELDATNQVSRGLLTADGASGVGLDAFNVRLGWTPSAIESFATLAARMYPFATDAFRDAGLRADPHTELLDTLNVPGRLAGRDPVNQAAVLDELTSFVEAGMRGPLPGLM